jgi:hypothetical protein
MTSNACAPSCRGSPIGVRTLLVAVLLLLAAAPAAVARSELGRAGAAVPTDQVYVSPQLRVTPQITDKLTAAAKQEAPDRVFVALLGGSPGLTAEDAVSQLRDRVGKPGAYAVYVNGSFKTTGSQEALDAGNAAFAAHRMEGPLAVMRDFIARVGSGDDGGGGGGGAGVVILLGAVVVGGGALLLARRRRREREDAEFAEVKDRARDEVVALGEDISALDLDVRRAGLPDATRSDYETAVNAYDRADTAWEQARRPEDLAPVGAALEEGRWAMESTRARLEGRESPERRPPCFFDPRHGPSSRDVEWAPDGGAPRPVPACEADAQRVERGLMPESREVTLGGRTMPYYAAGPMYAPFMGGFFGGGLLPGLLIGSALDWDGPGFDAGGGDFGGGDFGGGDFGGGDFGGGDF